MDIPPPALSYEEEKKFIRGVETTRLHAIDLERSRSFTVSALLITAGLSPLVSLGWNGLIPSLVFSGFGFVHGLSAIRTYREHKYWLQRMIIAMEQRLTLQEIARKQHARLTHVQEKVDRAGVTVREA